MVTKNSIIFLFIICFLGQGLYAQSPASAETPSQILPQTPSQSQLQSSTTGGSSATSLTPSSNATSQNSAKYHWYDGENKMSLELVPNQVIHFLPVTGVNAATPKALKLQSSKPLKGGAKLLHLTKESYLKYLEQGEGLLKAGSPLFKEGGQFKALPGGIIVSFKPEVSESEIQSLCEIYKLKLKKKLSPEGVAEVWLIETPSGLESLRLSNDFIENHSNIVANSRPNFWQPINTRELKATDTRGLKRMK